MAGILRDAGYALVDTPAASDIVIINSCTVKGPSQDSLFSLLRALGDKPKIVAGCVPQADPKSVRLSATSVVGVQQIGRIAEAVALTLTGNRVELLGKGDLPSLALPKVRRNPHIEIIPINLGCLSACTYCKTKHARGHLRSYPVEDIVERAKQAVAEGVSQLWLTSEDAGAYGVDIGSDLPTLLYAILDAIPSSIMIRIGMANPPYIARHIDAMADILRKENVFSFLHIPVQSGSDAVLRAMRRGYSSEEFQSLVDGVRSKVPSVAIATDIICGFPGETVDDHRMTLDLVRRNTFPILNISQFYPRPGTPAARMTLLPTQEVKRRSTEVTRLFKSQHPYASLVGTTGRVWFSQTSDDGMSTVGHTKSYVLVFVQRDDALLGSSRMMRFESASKHCMHGVIVDIDG